MSTQYEAVLQDEPGPLGSETPRPARSAFALTEAMRGLLCEIAVCTQERLLMAYPNAQAMRALRALKLIRVEPAGLKGWWLSLTARGVQLAEAFKSEDPPRPRRAWWLVSIRGRGSAAYFGTEAEAEAHALERRRNHGGGALLIRPAKQTEALAGKRRLEWRRAAGYPLDERELEGLA